MTFSYSNHPGALAFGGQQAAEDHAWKMSRGHGRVGAFDLSRERIFGLLGQLGVDVTQAGPFVVDELDGAVHDIAEEQAARCARREDDDCAAWRVPGRAHQIDARNE